MPAVATSLPLGTPTSGFLASFASTLYRVSSTAGGQLVVTLQAQEGFAARVVLVDAVGEPLLDSDADAAGAATLTVSVPAGDDLIEVESLGGAGSYQITASIPSAAAPFQPIPVNLDGGAGLAVADLTDRGVDDLLTGDGIRPGLGNGTFAANPLPGSALVDPGWSATVITTLEFGHDTLPDLAVAEIGPNGAGALRLLRNLGDDQFAAWTASFRWERS